MTALFLSTDGSGWAGSFALAVEALAQDLLSDGAFLTVTITTVDDARSTNTVTGLLTAADGGYLTIDGVRHEIADSITQFSVEETNQADLPLPRRS